MSGECTILKNIKPFVSVSHTHIIWQATKNIWFGVWKDPLQIWQYCQIHLGTMLPMMQPISGKTNLTMPIYQLHIINAWLDFQVWCSIHSIKLYTQVHEPVLNQMLTIWSILWSIRWTPKPQSKLCMNHTWSDHWHLPCHASPKGWKVTVYWTNNPLRKWIFMGEVHTGKNITKLPYRRGSWWWWCYIKYPSTRDDKNGSDVDKHAGHDGTDNNHDDNRKNGSNTNNGGVYINSGTNNDGNNNSNCNNDTLQ